MVHHQDQIAIVHSPKVPYTGFLFKFFHCKTGKFPLVLRSSFEAAAGSLGNRKEQSELAEKCHG